MQLSEIELDSRESPQRDRVESVQVSVSVYDVSDCRRATETKKDADFMYGYGVLFGERQKRDKKKG